MRCSVVANGGGRYRKERENRGCLATRVLAGNPAVPPSVSGDGEWRDLVKSEESGFRMFDILHQFLHSLPRALRFLPLFAWGTFAFGALYSLLETEFRPLPVLWSSLGVSIRILRKRWRISAALLALFIGAPILEAVAVRTLELRGGPLMLAALVWQAVTAAAIGWIATYIHGDALPLPERGTAALRRYRMMSSLAGLAVFVIRSALSLGLSGNSSEP